MVRNDGAEQLLVLLWKSTMRSGFFPQLAALLKLLLTANIFRNVE
jgi:hypothetical protein